MPNEFPFPPDDEEVELREPVKPAIHLEAISAHLDRYLGGERLDFHERQSDLVHLDVLHVASTPQVPFQTLATSGMSEKPMNVPEGFEPFRLAELVMILPSEWPVSYEAFHDPKLRWPLEWLAILARIPHEKESYFFEGHTIHSFDRQPIENTPFTGFIIALPLDHPEGFPVLRLADGRPINFWQVVPILPDEMAYKLKHGSDELLNMLGDSGACGPIDIHRKSCLPKRKRFGIF